MNNSTPKGTPRQPPRTARRTPLPSSEQATLELLNAASANPLPREEVVTRLGTALQRNLNYLSYRQRRKRRTAYDELLEQDLEAIASAIHYLQRADDEASEWKTRYSELLKMHNKRRPSGSEASSC